MRVMTDFCAEQYWTVVSEMEVPNLQAFEDMMSNPQGSAEDMKQFKEVLLRAITNSLITGDERFTRSKADRPPAQRQPAQTPCWVHDHYVALTLGA